MGRYRESCELRGPENPFNTCAMRRLPWCALRVVEAGGPGLACTDYDIDYLDELDAGPLIPLNAVTYLGEPVTYEGEYVTY